MIALWKFITEWLLLHAAGHVIHHEYENIDYSWVKLDWCEQCFPQAEDLVVVVGGAMWDQRACECSVHIDLSLEGDTHITTL